MGLIRSYATGKTAVVRLPARVLLTLTCSLILFACSSSESPEYIDILEKDPVFRIDMAKCEKKIPNQVMDKLRRNQIIDDFIMLPLNLFIVGGTSYFGIGKTDSRISLSFESAKEIKTKLDKCMASKGYVKDRKGYIVGKMPEISESLVSIIKKKQDPKAAKTTSERDKLERQILLLNQQGKMMNSQREAAEKEIKRMQEALNIQLQQVGDAQKSLKNMRSFLNEQTKRAEKLTGQQKLIESQIESSREQIMKEMGAFRKEMTEQIKKERQKKQFNPSHAKNTVTQDRSLDPKNEYKNIDFGNYHGLKISLDRIL